MDNGKAAPTATPPHLVAPLGVAYRADDVAHAKPRTVFDASATGLNAASPDWRFRYAGVAAALRGVEPGDWLVKVDLAKWFTQLPMHPVFQQMLGYRWQRQY